MLKKILSYGFVEGLAKGLNKSIFLLLPFFLNTTEFGKISLLVSVELLIPLLTLLGLEKAVLRFYSEKSKYQFFNKTVSIATIFSNLILLFILFILYINDMKYIFSLKIFPDLFLIIILVYFQGYNRIKFNILRVEERHKTYYRGRLFFQVSKFVLILVIVYLSGSYLGYLYGGIVAALSTSILLKFSFETSQKEKFYKSTFLSLFSFSWPFMLHGLSVKMLANADKFIIEEFLTLNEVGTYTFAYSIGSMMLFAYIGVSVYMEPLIYKAKNKKSLEALLSKYLALTLSSGLIAFLIIIIASTYVVPILYDESYNVVLDFIPLIAIAYMIYPYYLKSNYRMIYYNKSLNVALISILSAMLNITLNILLMPEYGIFAAVFATAISFFFQSILFTLLSNKFQISKEFFEVLILGSVVLLIIYFEISFYLSVIPMVIILFINNIKKINPWSH